MRCRHQSLCPLAQEIAVLPHPMAESETLDLAQKARERIMPHFHMSARDNAPTHNDHIRTLTGCPELRHDLSGNRCRPMSVSHEARHTTSRADQRRGRNFARIGQKCVARTSRAELQNICAITSYRSLLHSLERHETLADKKALCDMIGARLGLD